MKTGTIVAYAVGIIVFLVVSFSVRNLVGW